jgi:hypothetical protein
MRKVTLHSSLGRSLPLTTSVVMAAQQPDTGMVDLGDGVSIARDELVVLQGNRNQRRLQRKALLKGQAK